MIVVVEPGPLTTVQDFGRPGHAHLGVPLSGAVDRTALRDANRIAGNVLTAAALETTLAGPVLRFEQAAVVAVTGGRCAVTVDDVPVVFGSPVAVPAGSVLRLGAVVRGVRSYVAVRGGLDVSPVLGSRSTCTLSGLGPPALRAGDRLRVGSAPAGAVVPGVVLPAVEESPVLRAWLGPRDDVLTGPALALLGSSAWTVAAASDRTGVRLRGPVLERTSSDELASEGVVPGAVQLPPDGQPILFLAGCPTTGGYPVVAVVDPVDLRHAAQAAPGTALRFRLAAAAAP